MHVHGSPVTIIATAAPIRGDPPICIHHHHPNDDDDDDHVPKTIVIDTDDRVRTSLAAIENDHFCSHLLVSTLTKVAPSPT